jgi:hypothetical protein
LFEPEAISYTGIEQEETEEPIEEKPKRRRRKSE